MILLEMLFADYGQTVPILLVKHINTDFFKGHLLFDVEFFLTAALTVLIIFIIVIIVVFSRRDVSVENHLVLAVSRRRLLTV